jgi:hypothetical protein
VILVHRNGDLFEMVPRLQPGRRTTHASRKRHEQETDNHSGYRQNHTARCESRSNQIASAGAYLPLPRTARISALTAARMIKIRKG